MFCCFKLKQCKYQERLINQPKPVIKSQEPEFNDFKWNVYKPLSLQN
jgi:hypothetical protein